MFAQESVDADTVFVNAGNNNKENVGFDQPQSAFLSQQQQQPVQFQPLQSQHGLQSTQKQEEQVRLDSHQASSTSQDVLSLLERVEREVSRIVQALATNPLQVPQQQRQLEKEKEKVEDKEKEKEKEKEDIHDSSNFVNASLFGRSFTGTYPRIPGNSVTRLSHLSHNSINSAVSNSLLSRHTRTRM
jgi:hypothetical protein